MNPDWLNYEYMCMREHENLFNEIAFHWTRIPEKLLFQAGFIHDFNKLRMKRKEVFFEKKQKQRLKQRQKQVENPIREYGIDGLAFNEATNSFNAIQCKFWSKSKYLCASELGSFYQVVYHRMMPKNQNSRGTLYYTCKLQADVRDDFKNCSTIKVVHYVPQTEEKDEEKKETTEIILRPSQIENLNLLNQNMQKTNYKINLFVSPCGYGKTELIMRHSQFMKHDIIIICSPLQEHSRQTLKRFEKMFPDYQGLLIDCESDGCRDIEKIHELIKQKNVILSMTYKSALDILPTFYNEYNSDSDSYSETEDSENEYSDSESENNSENTAEMKCGFDFSNTIIYVDEAHNVNDKFIEILEKFPNKSLLVTATPPLFLEEDYNANVVCNYKMSTAIANKEICDYMVYFPFMHHEFIVPTELHGIKNQDFCKKSIFLLVGMLRTGSRRNITFLNSKEECREFIKVLNKVNERYFYLNIWSDMIHSDIPHENRQEIRSAFASDEVEDTIKILCNIRILSENIDIIECDSTFHTNITDASNQITMVQRMCRANRLDRNNPNKIANTFMWCDPDCDIVRVLSLLKENDPNFYKKVRVMSSEYDSLYSEKVNSMEEKEEDTLIEYINVECLTREEVFNKKFEIFKEFVLESKRVPTWKEKKNEINLGQWYNNSQKQKIKKGDMILLDKLSHVHECVKVDLQEYLKKEKKEIKTFEESLEIFKEFVLENKRVPQQKEKKNEFNIGSWYNSQKKKIKEGDTKILDKLSQVHECVKVDLQDYLKKEKKEKKSFEESLEIFKEFVLENKRVPQQKEKKNEFNIGSWYSTQKAKIKEGDMILLDKFSQVHECVKVDLQEYLKKEVTEKKPFEESLEIFKEFVLENERVPRHNEKKNENNIGHWYGNQKTKIKDGNIELLDKLSQVHECVKVDLQDYLKKEKKDKKTFEESLEVFQGFVLENKRVPQQKEKKNEFNIGSWYGHQKAKIKEGDMILLDKLSQVHECVKKDLQQYLKKEVTEIKTFEEWLEVFKEFVLENKRVPMNKEKKNEINIGMWYQARKTKIKEGDMILLDKLSQVHEFVKADLQECLKKEKKEIKPFEESLKIFKEFVLENERVPRHNEKKNENNIGHWYGNQKTKIKDGNIELLDKLSQVHEFVKADLQECLKKEKKEIKPFEESLEVFKIFVLENKRVPRHNEKKNEINLGQWYNNSQKQKIKKGDMILLDKLSQVHECVKKDLQQYLKKEVTEIKTFEEWLEVFQGFVLENKRVPQQKEKKNEFNIGSWYNNQKTKIKEGDMILLDKLSQVHECVKSDLQECLKKEKKDIKSFEESLEIFQGFVLENKRVPKATEKKNEFNIGPWYGHQKAKIKEGDMILLDKLSQVHECVKKNLDEYLEKKTC
jgi:superfamily II DNA or RNA helicase